MSLLTKRSRNGGVLPSLRNDLSDIFDVDRFFSRPFFESPILDGNRFSRMPATNIRESDDEYCVELAAPGMKKKDFQIELDNGVLEIQVEKEEQKEEDLREYTRREYDYSAFYRSFNLPDTVNAEKIKAEYEDGVLQIHLPKVPEARRKPVKEILVA